MKAKIFVTLFLFGILSLNGARSYSNEPISIEQADGRREARFHASEAPAGQPTGGFEAKLDQLEDKTAHAAQRTTQVVGGSTDKAVQTVEKVSGNLFSRFFQKADHFLKKHFETS